MLLLILSFRVMGSWGNGLLSLICRAASSIALRDHGLSRLLLPGWGL